MKGKYKIIVQNKKLRYDFEIKRNITIIKGDSATGKTTLIDMIRNYNNLGAGSGINLSCNVPCKVLEGSDWKLVLSNNSGVIFFTDEENAFIRSKEFAEAVSGSDNYYVLITRENLYELPYSVDEIYGISSSGRYQTMKQVYQHMYHIYSQQHELPVSAEELLVEDEGSGFDFYRTICDEVGISCMSVGGNSNVYNEIKKIDKSICVVADGAAFGPYMNRTYSYASNHNSVNLYLPESFEWIILKSGIVDGNEVQEILNVPWESIDSKDYISWERYFTSLLISVTKDTYLSYNKSRLNDVYLQDRNKNRILDVIEEGLKLR